MFSSGWNKFYDHLIGINMHKKQVQAHLLFRKTFVHHK